MVTVGNLMQKDMVTVDVGTSVVEGRVEWLPLVCANKTAIRRHLKIRAKANPYDPSWRPYFHGRRSDPMYNDRAVVVHGSEGLDESHRIYPSQYGWSGNRWRQP